MYRKVLILCTAWIVFFGGAGYAKESPLNVDAFFGWDGCYRPMEWTPVEIGISSSLTEPFEGTVSISAQQDGLNRLNVSHAFVLTPDIPLHLPLVTKFAFAADQCTVRIADRRGKTVWRNNFDLWDFSETTRVMTSVEHQDLLIGLVGVRRFGILRLPDEAVCKTQKGQGKVYVKDKVPRMAPWDWTGYACLDLLILYDLDYNTLRPQQLNAIAEWVSNGGRLLVVLGSNPLTAENPIARLLPFEIGKARQVRLDRKTLNGWGLGADEQKEVVCRPLSARPDARICRTDRHVDDLCLFAVGCVGFGRVAVMGFDPAALSDSQRGKSSEFWVGRLAEVLGDSLAAVEVSGSSRRREGNMTGSMGRLSTMRRIALAANEDSGQNRSNYNRQRHDIGPAQTASNGIIDYLYNIAEMRPLSIGWVIGILTLLAILLGPVDYIVLKRKGCLPLTWVTSTGWIVLFTVGAYYGVQALRGGNMQMRVVSISDGIDGSDCAWSTAHSGLFAPSSRNYRLEGLADNQWFSGITPTETQIYAYSHRSATRNIYCVQHDGSNLPSSLPINIWTMQCLLSESPIETMPFKAEVLRSGDRATVNITNLSDEVIINGYVLFGGSRALSFGSVGAGEKKEYTGSLRARSDAIRQMLTNYQRGSSRRSTGGRQRVHENAYLSQGSLQRTMAIRDYLAHGAAVVCVEYENAATPFAVKGRACEYSHVQLVRLVVFPDELKDEI